MTALFILVALAWASWLFNGAFVAKKRLLLFAGFSLASILIAYGLYAKLGSEKSIRELAELHQSLEQDDLKSLLEKTANKTISIEELFSEVRLRNLESNDKNGWMTFGRLLLQSEQKELAAQAFSRAASFGSASERNSTKLEIAQTYIENQEFKAALNQIELALLSNPRHEGALLLRGVAAMRLQDYQLAIDSWSFMLAHRSADSESAKLLQEQINLAEQKLAEQKNNYIAIEIDNFANLPLHSFTKAFALVRPVAGGAPIAVKVFDVHEFPQNLKITPENLMIATSDFWQVIDLYVEVRLSKSGLAKPEPGDIYGRSEAQLGLKPTQEFKISIDKTVN
ncbi:MAG: hypothetical protein HWE16_15900 [Gammaproteobacteria bacterium]|nr:hypothetical protein [Gammaproteobacteria bacterium]